MAGIEVVRFSAGWDQAGRPVAGWFPLEGFIDAELAQVGSGVLVQRGSHTVGSAWFPVRNPRVARRPAPDPVSPSGIRSAPPGRAQPAAAPQPDARR